MYINNTYIEIHMYLHINIEGNVLLPQDINMVSCDTIVETITPAAVTVASGEYLLSIYLLILIY